jgi:uncharacterized iron-regulated membrane protein
MAPRRNFRKTHRFLVPIAAAPLLLTALTGSLYPIFESFDMKADWLMQLHTGNFGVINLQSFYSSLLGLLTIILAFSGLGLWAKNRRSGGSEVAHELDL